LKECGLELHREKTKIVSCNDANRKESHLNENCDFLGYSVLQEHTEKEFNMN
jgi:RNA-directed DNA polymerase